MSFAQFLETENSASVDHEYLNRLLSIPPGMSDSERATLNTSLEANRVAQKDLASQHKSNFILSKNSMDSSNDMIRELHQVSEEAVETSLAAPKSPEKAYSVSKSLLENEFVVYQQIDQIQESLALPELVRDRVLRSDFTTALDLSSMTDRLSKRFPNSAIVQQLRKDVHRSVVGMEDMLSKSLKQAARLPQLTRAISFLRRMQTPHSEHIFIESRWEFLQSQWDMIPPHFSQTQPLVYLKRVVEIYREHVFATINGFQTIFNREHNQSGNVHLSTFARNSLNTLSQLLRKYAPQIRDQGDRASLWLQLAFCAQSLGRIECDFWPFLDEEILSKKEWEEATQYQQDMAKRNSRPLNSATIK